MPQFKFVITTTQTVTAEAPTMEEAENLVRAQLPLNSTIMSIVDCDAANLRQLTKSEISNLVQSEKLTSEPKGDIIYTENDKESGKTNAE